jgi:hypothetical protein
MNGEYPTEQQEISNVQVHGHGHGNVSGWILIRLLGELLFVELIVFVVVKMLLRGGGLFVRF